ncbi:hypothetical protein CL6EHI_075740 [Entamoeba histolytica]|uniref:Uncharacterized protein n=3 Tax=Entamoeba histolytica TaxID=5759 RepID=C4M997_ENTH1|nr:hypothetical protein EHI_075740 [Entamoeba histolytica HM-1:IMSS]EAL43385.1 hypothetical protein EHI_075740 [Entamoeba histolytica HM-1:IMSS]GAT98229.1 hypothetical protein CL6EHI_075740 [Entamoeba histolytica]|eukprot:XP_648778.1 hypothetical protein EHI_075740 [Entamoeba histolytica HM-1:IMSS]
MRFCPNTTDLDTNVTCTMNINNYKISYLLGVTHQFNYSHFQYDDNDETECIFNIQPSVKSVNFNNDIKYTTLHIEYDITLNNFVYTKQINVEDNIKLTTILS